MECHNEYKTYTALTSCGNGYKASAGFSKQYCKCEVLTLVTDYFEIVPKFDQTTSCCLLLQKYKLKKKSGNNDNTSHLAGASLCIILSINFVSSLYKTFSLALIKPFTRVLFPTSAPKRSVTSSLPTTLPSYSALLYVNNKTPSPSAPRGRWDNFIPAFL